jgi:hypothetical protein
MFQYMAVLRQYSALHQRLAVVCLATLCIAIFSPRPLFAQEVNPAPGAGAEGATLAADRIDGPPAPDPPDVINRDEDGHATVRTMRLPSPLVIDGALDEAPYKDVPPMSGFIQQEPAEGHAASDKTEIWIFYDDKNLYVGAKMYEDDPARRVTSDLRRDSTNLYNNDHIAIVFDTFYDRRNGFGVSSNAQGGMFDWVVTNEQPNSNFNPVWQIRTAEFDGGWSAEMVVPFRSLRFKPDSTIWGVNVRRMVRWRNEISFLNPVPRSWGRRGLSKISSAATMVGLRTPGNGLNLDIKPYALGSSSTNRRAAPPYENDGNGEWGVDAKWGVTQTLIADLTYNTDFAQVEDDEAQVNLTRFSLFFPERRDFFLEGQDIFAFAGVGGGGSGGGGGGNSTPSAAAAANQPNNTPILFYSRRIGLDAGQIVPILAGGRLLGRTGPYNVGALNMQTSDVPEFGKEATNFSVVRMTRDILRRSRIGVIGTARSPSASAIDQSFSAGADAQFQLYENVNVQSYYARTDTPGRTGDSESYRGRYDWNADRYGIQSEYLKVGEDFEPEVGFLRRRAFKRSYGFLRYSPRPAQPSPIRKVYYEGFMEYITGPGAKLETRQAQGAYRLELNNGDFASLEVARNFEGLTRPFTVGSSVVVPVGDYSFTQTKVNYTFGPQRPINGSLDVTYGGFYDGTLAAVAWKGRLELGKTYLVEPSLSWNRGELPWGDFTTNLVAGRFTWTMSNRRFFSILMQYQSATTSFTTNARFRWEYVPGSEFFVVYSDGRSTLGPGYPELENRSFIVKVTRLLRW